MGFLGLKNVKLSTVIKYSIIKNAIINLEIGNLNVGVQRANDKYRPITVKNT